MPDAIEALYNALVNTEQIQNRIATKATSLGMDPALALSIAHQESGFNPRAISPKRGVGLYQVTNDTGVRYGQTPATRFDPDVRMCVKGAGPSPAMQRLVHDLEQRLPALTAATLGREESSGGTQSQRER